MKTIRLIMFLMVVGGLDTVLAEDKESDHLIATLQLQSTEYQKQIQKPFNAKQIEDMIEKGFEQKVFNKDHANAKHSSGLPALHYTITFDIPSVKIVEILLKHGADKNVPATETALGFKKNETPLQYVQKKLIEWRGKKDKLEQPKSVWKLMGGMFWSEPSLKECQQSIKAFEGIEKLLQPEQRPETKDEAPATTAAKDTDTELAGALKALNTTLMTLQSTLISSEK